MPQESLSATSRTYLSQLERGRQTPTLDKLDAISEAIGVHPLSLLIYAYTCERSAEEIDRIQERVRTELAALERYDSQK